MNGTEVTPAPSKSITAAADRPAGPMHFAFVDALRGFAILGVMLVHASLWTQGFSGRLKGFAGQGQYGVQLFFVVSAFTLFWSLRSRTHYERSPLLAFYTRRVFRIGPLFWIAIAFYCWSYGLLHHPYPKGIADYLATRAPNGVYWPHVLLTAVFMHGWYPTTINVIVPGGWSIGAEFCFYLTIPLLFSRIKSLSQALWLTLIATLLVGLGEGPAITHLSHHFPTTANWNIVIREFVERTFIDQFPVFCLGMVLYFLLLPRLTHGTDAPPVPGNKPTALFLLCFGIMVIFDIAPRHVLVSAAFVAIAYGLSIQPFKLMVNPLTRFIGTVSYSGYIWHFWVLDHVAKWAGAVHIPHLSKDASGNMHFILTYLGTAICVLPIATASYYLIEAPAQKVGKTIIRQCGWGSVRRG
jgi:peptidoglycan/LPS O-acetylase OafA/YrhL